MKLSNRVLSVLLLVVFVLTSTVLTPAFAAGFSDVAETDKYSKAVTTLNTLGIINGYEDGTFKPENNVTRAEFTAMLLRAKGVGDMGSTSLEDPPYPDVVSSDVSWAIGNIRTAKSMGIVNGYEDGTFRPSNNVLYEEALKMIVCALGYANYSPEGAEWYTKYLTSATKLGIIKGVEGSVGVPATRAIIAQMLYNCLEVNVAEDNESSGKTLLDKNLNLTKKTGIIASNKVTSLTAPNINLRDNEILITDCETNTTSKYIVDSMDKYKDMLGVKVQYYFEYSREAGANLLSSASVMSDASIEIKAGDLEPSTSTGSTLKYYKDGQGREQSVNISDNSIVIYNEKLYGATTAASTFARYFAAKGLPTIGSVKLMDNDSDGTYDIIFVNEYDVYVVDTASSSTYTVTDKILKDASNNNRSIVLNPNEDDNLYFVDTKGAELSFSSITKGSTISVKKSNPSNGGDVLTTVVINKTNAKGKVSGIVSGESITIGSVTYKFSDAAPWMSGRSSLLAEPKMGDSATFYLDLNGDVVAYDKSTTSDTNQNYGYIISASVVTNNMEDTLRLRILTKDKQRKFYDCDKNSKLNGSTISDANTYLNTLKASATLQAENVEKESAGASSAASQVIKFTVRNGNIIDEIITAEEGDPVSSIETDKLIMSSSFKAAAETKYNSSNGLTANGGSKKVRLSGAIMFCVPKDRSSSDDFTVISTSDLKSGRTYNVEIFDLTTANLPKVVVFYNLNKTVGEVTYSTPLFVVETVSQEDNGSNGIMYKLEGKQITISGKLEENKSFWGSEESEALFATLKKGDVIRLGKDSKGFSTLKKRDILYGMDIDRDEVIRINDPDVIKGEDSSITNDVIGAVGYAAGSGRYYIVDDDDNTAIPGKINDSNSTTKFLWGDVYDYVEDAAVILDKPAGGAEPAEETKHTYTKSDLSGACVLIYEKAGNSINILHEEAGYEAVLGDKPSDVFVYTYNTNNVRLIIVRR